MLKMTMRQRTKKKREEEVYNRNCWTNLKRYVLLEVRSVLRLSK